MSAKEADTVGANGGEWFLASAENYSSAGTVSIVENGHATSIIDEIARMVCDHMDIISDERMTEYRRTLQWNERCESCQRRWARVARKPIEEIRTPSQWKQRLRKEPEDLLHLVNGQAVGMYRFGDGSQGDAYRLSMRR